MMSKQKGEASEREINFSYINVELIKWSIKDKWKEILHVLRTSLFDMCYSLSLTCSLSLSPHHQQSLLLSTANEKPYCMLYGAHIHLISFYFIFSLTFISFPFLSTYFLSFSFFSFDRITIIFTKKCTSNKTNTCLFKKHRIKKDEKIHKNISREMKNERTETMVTKKIYSSFARRKKTHINNVMYGITIVGLTIYMGEF